MVVFGQLAHSCTCDECLSLRAKARWPAESIRVQASFFFFFLNWTCILAALLKPSHGMHEPYARGDTRGYDCVLLRNLPSPRLVCLKSVDCPFGQSSLTVAGARALDCSTHSRRAVANYMIDNNDFW